MNIFSKIIYRAGKIVWRIIKPVTAGARVILIKDSRILLVKHTYQEHWYLPGGGIKKGETFEEAIRRELREELGGQLGELRLFGVYNNFFENKNDHIVIFLCSEFTITGKVNKEIKTFDFFDLNSLPEHTAPGTRRRIQEYIKGQFGGFGKW